MTSKDSAGAMRMMSPTQSVTPDLQRVACIARCALPVILGCFAVVPVLLAAQPATSSPRAGTRRAGSASPPTRSQASSPARPPTTPPHANAVATSDTTSASPAGATLAVLRRTPGERPQTATELVEAATREYQTTSLARAVQLGTALAYPYGVAEPVLTCPVLRACVVELEPGERLATRPIAGDRVRWHI